MRINTLKVTLLSKQVISSVNVIQYKSLHSSRQQLLVKTIEFKTCGQLYDKLRQKNPKLYRNSPSSGLTVNVEYVDTLGDNKTGKVKTILAIHGIPGYYNHFDKLYQYFGNKCSSVRVIAPNMPDFGLTRQTMAFWHSNEERSQFIRDFLKAINVSTIDCLVSHSAGIHPISMLWTDPQELAIKSIGLFCPQPLWLSKNVLFYSELTSYLAKHKLGIKLMDTIRPDRIAHRFGYPMSYANVDEVLLTVCFGSISLNQQLLHQRLQFIRQHKIPTLMVLGERDKLILKNNLKYLFQDLGVNDSHFVKYLSDKDNDRSDNKTNDKSENDINKDWIKVLSFADGGHFAFNKFSNIVNKQLVIHLLS
ncbi:uncharacterized protein LOC128951179 [Oppia nitens]|uniref:uncharacterized protein LOC128951179 n=1 Tax=Oppia nitens TaxID=1686743 RepID=UPI0023DC9204|nr:uncharacterized protein LOC128951179 [Oppia nitens]